MEEFVIGLLVIFGAILFIPAVLFLKIALSVLIGTFMAWMLTFTSLSTWVTTGASLLGLHIPVSQLPALGSFLGFLAAFMPRSTNAKNPFEDKK